MEKSACSELYLVNNYVGPIYMYAYTGVAIDGSYGRKAELGFFAK